MHNFAQSQTPYRPRRVPAHIWVDGFSQLSPPEIGLLCALAKRSSLTLTLPEEGVSPTLKDTLLARGFREERITGVRRPCEIFVKPETADREVEEIARRVLEAAEAGTPFREMGVILRQPSKYVPLLRAACERFGIPAHFYFGDPFATHIAGRLFSGVIEALLGGWDHEQTLGLLRLIPVAGASNNLDVLELKIRETMPGNGLEELAPRASGRSLHRVFRQLRSLERWLNEKHTPERWAAEFELLPALLWPGYIEDHLAPEQVSRYRDQAASLRAFTEAIQSAAAWWRPGSSPIPLSEFWRVAKAVIRLTTVVPRSLSRNVVSVVDAFEARQWDFSVAFVCGLVEKDFPAQNGRDPFLSDAALHDLARFGIRARTAADKDIEEFGLFEAVRMRARNQLVLTCPRLDARGQPALPSIFLKGREPGAVAPAVRPALPPPVAPWRRPVAIRSSDLLQVLTEQQTRISVSNLESLLQCPFQFFARRALRISEFPERPEDRLNFLVQGNIAHEVLRDWFLERPDLDAQFARVFDRVCAENHVLPGFRTERLRRAMQLSLQCFINDTKYLRPAFSELEKLFEFAIDDTLTITGRLDRIDQLENGSWVVVDYKFSTAANTKDKVDDESKLQGPLYALALHRVFGHHPSAMVYASLKDKVHYYGWGSVPGLNLDPITPDWMDRALDRVRTAVAEFRSGVIHPRPMNTGPCRYCDYRDACRVEQPTTLAGAGA